MSQNGNSAGVMNPIDHIFHVCGTNASCDAITENVRVAAMKGKFEARNNNEVLVRERFTEFNVVLHPSIIKNLSVIAHRNKVHAGSLENLNELLQRLFTVG